MHNGQCHNRRSPRLWTGCPHGACLPTGWAETAVGRGVPRRAVHFAAHGPLEGHGLAGVSRPSLLSSQIQTPRHDVCVPLFRTRRVSCLPLAVTCTLCQGGKQPNMLALEAWLTCMLAGSLAFSFCERSCLRLAVRVTTLGPTFEAVGTWLCSATCTWPRTSRTCLRRCAGSVPGRDPNGSTPLPWLASMSPSCSSVWRHLRR